MTWFKKHFIIFIFTSCHIVAYYCIVIMFGWSGKYNIRNFPIQRWNNENILGPKMKWNIKLKGNYFKFDSSIQSISEQTEMWQTNHLELVGFLLVSIRKSSPLPPASCVKCLIPEWPEGLLCLMFSVNNLLQLCRLFFWRGDFEISNFNQITIQQMFMVYCDSLIISLSDSIEIYFPL